MPRCSVPFRRVALSFLPFVISASPCLAAADLDPEALAVLKATADSVGNAQSFSFRARVHRDRMSAKNEIVTFFSDNTVTVSRPDKVRMDISGEGQDLQFFFDGTQVTIFEPGSNLYASEPAPPTIDGTVASLRKRGITFPVSELLQSNAYASLVDALQKASVVSRQSIYGRSLVHLAFTEASADWQLWIEDGEAPVPSRVEIIYKKKPGMSRVVVDFSEWNLHAQPRPETFQFVKSGGAQQTDLLPATGGKSILNSK